MINDNHGYAAIAGKVVIVEDDALMQRILVEMFSDLGGECAAFLTADDALIDMMQSKIKCELLVTDYTLPGQLNGRELAIMVRQRWPGVPVIVTTGYGAEIGNELPVGVAFLQKPWSMDVMVRTASQLISNLAGFRQPDNKGE